MKNSSCLDDVHSSIVEISDRLARKFQPALGMRMQSLVGEVTDCEGIDRAKCAAGDWCTKKGDLERSGSNVELKRKEKTNEKMRSNKMI